ncbi:hypothetical protein G6009_04755 [Dietzia sp. SLG510A3-30A2]|nr:hypothetical protein [Dietzia sp. SLG510A3-30A2]
MSWTETCIGNLATVVGGGTPSTRIADYWGGDIPWFTPAEISEGGAGVVTTSERLITNKGLAESAAKLLPPGTVLVTSRASIANCAIAGVPMATNQGFTSLTPKDARSTRFLYYWVQQNRGEFLSRAAGSTFLEISASKVRAIPITAPRPDEQTIIGKAIADADDLIATLERLIAKKQAIKQGMMQQLLTGRTRLPGFADPWTETRLGTLGKCIRGVGYDPGQDLSSSDRPHTIRLLRSNNVQRSRIDRDGLQFVHERRVAPSQVLEYGDIVICMANGSRALVGKAARFEPEVGEPRYTFGAFMGAFRTGKSIASSRFVAEILETHAFRGWLDVILSGSSINNLRPGDVEGFTTTIPGLTEQMAIADTLADADAEINLLHERLRKARDTKTGMMQQLLTGRTRLPVEAAS